MGDRGNIVVYTEGRLEKGIWFYTHWEGYRIKNILKNVLSREERWEDESYLARMIFSEMIRDNVEGSADFGISLSLGDNEYNILHVFIEEQVVEELTEEGKLVNKWTFEEYIRLDFEEEV